MSKVTVLNKSISTNVLAQDAASALALVQLEKEMQGLSISRVQVSRITLPDATKKTVQFVVDTGIHILGYFDGLQPHVEADPTVISVWNVMVDAEYVVDYDKAVAEAARNRDNSGNLEDVTDPNDRAGLATSAPQATSGGSAGTLMTQPSDTTPV